MREKWIRRTQKIFSAGCFILLILGVFSGFLLAAAFLTGGPAAETITFFLFNHLFPAMFRCNIAVCLIGLTHNYLAGDKSFRFHLGSDKNKS